VYLYKRQTNKQSDMSRPRAGQRVFRTWPLGYWAYIKYLLCFCKMSLNVSFCCCCCCCCCCCWERENKSLQCGSDAVTHITCSGSLARLVRTEFYRGCGNPDMGLDSGLSAGWPPGPRPWMSTLGTRGLWRPGCGAVGVRYMLLYMAAAAAAAVVLSTVPSRLGW